MSRGLVAFRYTYVTVFSRFFPPHYAIYLWEFFESRSFNPQNTVFRYAFQVRAHTFSLIFTDLSDPGAKGQLVLADTCYICRCTRDFPIRDPFIIRPACLFVAVPFRPHWEIRARVGMRPLFCFCGEAGGRALIVSLTEAPVETCNFQNNRAQRET